MKQDVLSSVASSRFTLGSIRTHSDIASLDAKLLAHFLQRHANGDFGEVDYDHYLANYEMLANQRGYVTSTYNLGRGQKRLHISTRLDDFEPYTDIYTVS